MTETLRSARLVLNTSLFYPNGSGSIAGSGALDPRLGTANEARTVCTFTNLDWTIILGDLYLQYRTFAFCIESITACWSGGTSITSPYNIMSVTATGLDWQDSTYDCLTKTKGSGCVIYSGGFNTYTPQITVGPIFRRPAIRYGDLTLTITNPVTGLVPGGNDRPGSLIYIIKIFGVGKV